jgi:hypothetical protein
MPICYGLPAPASDAWLPNTGKGMVGLVGAGVRAPFMTTDNIV